MSFLDRFRSKGHTAQSLSQEGVKPYQAPSGDIHAQAKDLRALRDDLDEWDVADDPVVEAEAAAQAERAEKEAAAAVARQRVLERQEAEAAAMKQRALEIEEARQKRVDAARLKLQAAHERLDAARMNVEATRAARAQQATEADQFRHNALDKVIKETRCWRCGTAGRIPMGQESTLTSRGPSGVTDPTVLDAQHSARLTKVLHWKKLNDERFVVERLRLDAYYHPALADRFTIARWCEVCGHEGMFHPDNLTGNYNEGGDVFSLFARWNGHFGDCDTVVKGVFKDSWEALSSLTRSQAKEWLKAPPSHPTSQRSWRKFQEEKAAFAERLAKPQVFDSLHYSHSKGAYYETSLNRAGSAGDCLT